MIKLLVWILAPIIPLTVFYRWAVRVPRDSRAGRFLMSPWAKVAAGAAAVAFALLVSVLVGAP